jgi:hypothetical protein
VIGDTVVAFALDVNDIVTAEPTRVTYRVLIVGIRRDDVEARCREIQPVAVRAEVGERAALICRTDRQHLRVGGRELRHVVAGVAGSHDDDNVVAGGVGDRIVEQRAVTRPAERKVDDLRSAEGRGGYRRRCPSRRPSSPWNTLIGMIWPFHAAPATPMPLLVLAATIPATMVPWPTSSVGAVPGLTTL